MLAAIATFLILGYLPLSGAAPQEFDEEVPEVLSCNDPRVLDQELLVDGTVIVVRTHGGGFLMMTHASYGAFYCRAPHTGYYIEEIRGAATVEPVKEPTRSVQEVADQPGRHSAYWQVASSPQPGEHRFCPINEVFQTNDRRVKVTFTNPSAITNAGQDLMNPVTGEYVCSVHHSGYAVEDLGPVGPLSEPAHAPTYAAAAVLAIAVPMAPMFVRR